MTFPGRDWNILDISITKKKLYEISNFLTPHKNQLSKLTPCKEMK